MSVSLVKRYDVNTLYSLLLAIYTLTRFGVFETIARRSWNE